MTKPEPSASSENIQVMIRVRPTSAAESSEAKCVTISGNTLTLDTRTEVRQFAFDHVAGESASQESVFEVAGKPLAQACLDGYNATVFAYGQTGAGKTYTIQGLTVEQVPDEKARYELRGLMPRIFEYIFTSIAKKEEAGNIRFIVKCSYMEIYMEQIVDLLEMQAENLHVREDMKHGVYVEGLTEETVDSSAALLDVVKRGLNCRHVGSTTMNKESSRSHSVLLLTIESKSQSEGVIDIRSSRFNIIDLAGSERQKSTDAVGERLKEAGNINRSLSILGNVINSLVESSQGKSRYIHYRDSKLTFLLKDSFGGNSKTVLIANVSPCTSCLAETFSTLSFAKRAKQVKNKAVINEDTTGTIMVLQQEIKRLKAEMVKLQMCRPRDSGSSVAMETTVDSREDSGHTGKIRELEQLLQSTVELRASDLLMYEERVKEKERTARLYQKEKERDKMIVKLKEAVIDKMQTDKSCSHEIDALKKEVQMLRDSEDKMVESQKTCEGKESGTLSQKIAEQNEYFQQMSKYIKELGEEKAELCVKVESLEDKLKVCAATADRNKIECLITKIKLDYGEKIEEMSKRYLEEKAERERLQEECDKKDQGAATNEDTFRKLIGECQKELKISNDAVTLLKAVVASRTKESEDLRAHKVQMESQVRRLEAQQAEHAATLNRVKELVSDFAKSGGCQVEGGSVFDQLQRLRDWLLAKENGLKAENKRLGKLSECQQKIDRVKERCEACVVEFGKREAAINETLRNIVKRQKWIEQQAKRVEDDKRKSRIILDQEAQIIQLKEKLGGAKEAEMATARLKEEVRKRQEKIDELEKNARVAAETVKELHEIKANLVTTGEEFRKLKLQLHDLREEKLALEAKCQALVTAAKEEATRVNAMWEGKLAERDSNRCDSELVKRIEKDNADKADIILQLQTAIKDSQSITSHWQREIDAKMVELENAKEQLDRNKIQIAYLAEQNRLLMDCNKTNLIRLKSYSAMINAPRTSEYEKLQTESRARLNEQTRANEELTNELAKLKSEKQQQSSELNMRLADVQKEQSKLSELNGSLLKDNLSLKEQLAKCEEHISGLKTTLVSRTEVQELQEKVDKIGRISSELAGVPEIKLVYDSRIKGKDPIQQIACALDYLLKLIRV